LRISVLPLTVNAGSAAVYSETLVEYDGIAVTSLPSARRAVMS